MYVIILVSIVAILIVGPAADAAGCPTHAASIYPSTVKWLALGAYIVLQIGLKPSQAKYHRH